MKTSILAAFVTAGSAMAASVLPPSLEGREIKPSGDGPTAITTNLVYADGSIYNASLPAGSFTEQFNMDMAVWTTGFGQAYSLALLAREVGHTYPYSIERQLLQAFIDQTPGAPKPVGFVRDNATLTATQTTYGWRSLERILYFAPDDSAPYASGMQWIPTAHTGVAKLFWNQATFEAAKKSGTYDYTPFLAFTFTASKFVDDLPPEFN